MSEPTTNLAGRARNKPRWKVVGLVVLLHLVVVAGLIRAFTPQIMTQALQTVTEAVMVTVTAPPPSPKPSPSAPATQDAGAAAAAGRKAEPRQASAPTPKVVVTTRAAPPVRGKGHENASGASDKGEGTGSQGAGIGTGAGGSGSGQGGGALNPPVKLSGEINSARDYPRETRDLRIGDRVIVALTVGVDGRVTGCRVIKPSRDAQADRITCRLATERFRFRPATDGGGRPVESTFGWQQKWFFNASSALQQFRAVFT